MKKEAAVFVNLRGGTSVRFFFSFVFFFPFWVSPPPPPTFFFASLLGRRVFAV